MTENGTAHHLVVQDDPRLMLKWVWTAYLAIFLLLYIGCGAWAIDTHSSNNGFIYKSSALAWLSVTITGVCLVIVLIYACRLKSTQFLGATREARVIIGLGMPTLILGTAAKKGPLRDFAIDALTGAFELGGWILLSGLIIGGLDVWAECVGEKQHREAVKVAEAAGARRLASQHPTASARGAQDVAEPLSNSTDSRAHEYGPGDPDLAGSACDGHPTGD